MGSVDTQRFAGFAKLYSLARPQPPKEAREIVLQYLRKAKPELAVDLGSGTGLSTAIWRGYCGRVVGIEPTPDMIRQARIDHPDLEFIEASSYTTSLPTGSAEVVTCSQSFHWMEPVAAIGEVDRVLASGGVFAVYDCEWPVSWDWEAELAYVALFRKVGEILKARPTRKEGIFYFPKSQHRTNIERSGKFRYVTEILFDHVEECDPERFIGIALSQGQIQELVKDRIDEIADSIEAFRKICLASGQRQMRVSYRMILAVK